MSKQIAIIGAGFAGLASCWYLVQSSDIEVTIFDAVGVGGGASGVAAGLLHMYAGVRSTRNPHAEEGLAATCELLEIATAALGAPVADGTGFLRVATGSRQLDAFTKCAKRFDDIEWWSASRCQKAVQGLAEFPGMFIHSGITVDCKRYLQGLWKACQERGARLVVKRVESLHELDSFDAVIVATGANLLPEIQDLPVRPIKGQLIRFEWPEGRPPLPTGINSSGYLVMAPDGRSCLAGSTFEKQFAHTDPDLQEALPEIERKIGIFYPPVRRLKPIQIEAGIRAATPDHQPIARQVGEKWWVLTGLGSKGLLYHALLAKQVAGKCSLPGGF